MSKMSINIKCCVIATLADGSLLFFKVFGNQSEVASLPSRNLSNTKFPSLGTA